MKKIACVGYHATGAGVIDDFISVGYHTVIDGDWMYAPKAPMARASTVGIE